MTVTDTDTQQSYKSISVEEFVDAQTRAVTFLTDVMDGTERGTEDELKARIIAAQTLIGSEPPLDTQAFLERVREQLHAELKDAGLDVEGALAEKKIVVPS